MEDRTKTENDWTFPPRDLIGYGADSKNPQWPREGVKVVVSFVVNFEEGAESCLLEGDAASEGLLAELADTKPLDGQRNLSVESIYEYGSRVGIWRLLRAFKRYEFPVTVFACGRALEQHPSAARAMMDAGWEIASHGYRWLDYRNVDERTEAEHIRKCVKVHQQVFGQRPLGFYQGKASIRTRRLVAEEGGFAYDNDSYADDLPYWDVNYSNPLLIIPYALDTNDMKFASTQGFNCGEQFYNYLRDAFEVLQAEGSGKLMSVGLHPRIIGRPGKMSGLIKFLDFLSSRNDVWVCRRVDIARHWYRTFPPRKSVFSSSSVPSSF